MNKMIRRLAFLSFALVVPAIASAQDAGNKPDQTPSGVTPAQPGAPGGGAVPASPALENRGEKFRDKVGARMEKRGEKLEKRGEHLEKRGERLERRGERVERRGERRENRGERLQRRGRR